MSLADLLYADDPYEALRRLQQPIRTGSAPRYRGRDEAELLKQLGPPEVSGLGKVANLLDVVTGASSVRDVLSALASGQPGRLLTDRNPFDQFLNPLSHAERGKSVSFRDVMTEAGVRPNQETGLRGWSDPKEAALDLLGFAGEVATDPGTWFGSQIVKGYAKAGKAAADMAKATRPGAAAIGAAQRVTDPLVDQFMAAFSKPAMGMKGAQGRAIAGAVHQGREQAATMAREAFAPEIEAFGKFTSGMNQDDMLRSQAALNNALEGTGVLPPNMAHLQGVRDSLRAKLDALPAIADAGGVNAPILQDAFVEYSGRRRLYAPDDEPMKRGAGGRGVSGRHEAQIKREEILKNIFGGTGMIQNLSIDPRFSGVVHRIKPSQLDKTFWKNQADEINRILRASGATDDLEHAPELAKWLGNLSAWHAEKKIPAFVSDPVETAMRRADAVQSAVEMNKVARDTIAPVLRQAGDDLPGDMAVKELFKKTGFNVKQSLNLLSGQIGKSADDLYVPKEVAERLLNVSRAFRSPDEVADTIFKPFQQYTQLWKNWVTSHPAFHNRNFVSGQLFNWMNNQFSAKSVAATWKLLHGKTVDMPWEKMGAEFRGLSNDEATKLFSRQAFADNVAPRGQGAVAEGTRDVLLSKNLAADIPGLQPLGIREALKRPGSLNPLDVENFRLFNISRGAGELTEGLNRISPYMELRSKGLGRAEAAARVRSAQIDYSNLTPFERQYMRPLLPFYSFTKGISTKVASELMEKPSGRLAQTLRAQHSAMVQELPMPQHVGEAGAIPWSADQEGNKSYITSLGLMHEDPLSFLGGSGGVPDMALGAATELASRVNPVVKAPVEMIFGESLFQRGPLGGRELNEADPSIGRLLTNIGLREDSGTGRASPFIANWVEHLAANSPINRAVTTARTLTDPRKLSDVGGLPVPGIKALANALTGVRFTDVSPASQDMAIRQRADKVALDELGGRVYQSTYIPSKTKQREAARGGEAASRIEALGELTSILSKRDRERQKAERLKARQQAWNQTAF